MSAGLEATFVIVFLSSLLIALRAVRVLISDIRGEKISGRSLPHRRPDFRDLAIDIGMLLLGVGGCALSAYALLFWQW